MVARLSHASPGRPRAAAIPAARAPRTPPGRPAPALAPSSAPGAALGRAAPTHGYHRRVLDVDPRTIEADAPQYNASLVRREDETESLASFWVRFDGDPTPFEAGQYMTIGVVTQTETGPRIVQRPYSVASDPAAAGSDGYEMYV